MSNADRLVAPITIEALDAAMSSRGLQSVAAEVAQLLSASPSLFAGRCLETRIAVEALGRIHEREMSGSPQTSVDLFALIGSMRHRAGLSHMSDVVKAGISRLKGLRSGLPEGDSLAIDALIGRVEEHAAALGEDDQGLIARVLDACCDTAQAIQQGQCRGVAYQLLLARIFQILGPDSKLFSQFGAGE